jgi:hypothetical protein
MRLSRGGMPPDIEDLLAGCKLSLFPASYTDLKASCDCPDAENPCKHIAAVYYLLAERFDADPFLIFPGGAGRRKSGSTVCGRAARARRPRARRHPRGPLLGAPRGRGPSGRAAPSWPICASARSPAKPRTPCCAASDLPRRSRWTQRGRHAGGDVRATRRGRRAAGAERVESHPFSRGACLIGAARLSRGAPWFGDSAM